MKQEAEERLQGKDIAEYVTRHQAMDREKRVDEIWMTQIEAEQARDQAKIQADKDLTLKEPGLQEQAQAQASTSAAAAPPPRNRVAKSLKLPAFIDKKEELDICLLHFERYAENASLEKNKWAF